MVKNNPDSMKFRSDYIEVRSYRYPPATIYPSGKIEKSEISDVGLSCTPPEIRTLDGEFLFIPATMKEELTCWCNVNNVPCRNRIDVWDLLLEPFLDTEFTNHEKEKTISRLHDCDIDAVEVESVRKRVSKAMIAYNFDSFLWDWVHLGLSDVLDAFLGILAGPGHKLSSIEYAQFYWYGMELASRGIIVGQQESVRQNASDSHLRESS